jgi:hypothetical protein
MVGGRSNRKSLEAYACFYSRADQELYAVMLLTQFLS